MLTNKPHIRILLVYILKLFFIVSVYCIAFYYLCIEFRIVRDMRIVALSDMHGALPAVAECDVVVIAGDIVPVAKECDGEESAEWFRGPFQEWALSLPCKMVVFIGGNHDRLLEYLLKEYTIEEIHNGLFAKDTENKIVLLHDSAYTFEGVVIYGTPWCPNLVTWAFYAEDEARRASFEEIPDCDILLTHCPAKIGTQGVVLQECKKCGSDFGDPILAEVLRTKRIGWVISGHIHSGDHNVEMLGDIRCRNCSIMDERYKESYPAFEFEV